MKAAEELIRRAKALLLDFDGPITTLMPPPRNIEAADSARVPLGSLDVPADVLSTTDHLTVLRWTSEHAVSKLVAVEQACTAAEVACARISEPSPEIEWLLEQATQRSIPVAVVSNNSDESVRTFLDRFSWADSIDAIAARTSETSRLLKPHPFLVKAGAQLLEVPPQRCVFVGDSVSDMQAGEAAGVGTIGLAKTPARKAELVAVGAQALLERHPHSPLTG